MSINSAQSLAEALHRRFLLDHPRDAAGELERMAPADAAAALAAHPLPTLLPTWEYLAPDVEVEIFRRLPQDLALGLLSERDPGPAAALLARLDHDEQAQWLAALAPGIEADLRALIAYPENTAGRMMHARVSAFRPDTTVGEALQRLRVVPARHRLRELFVVDEHNRLLSSVDIQDLALADDAQRLDVLGRPLQSAVQALDPQDDVVAQFERYKFEQLPVIDVRGRLLGVIHHSGLVQALQDETSADLLTMVGASKEERALSGAWFAVRKRLPWMQINLGTAFLAAMVVGLFEDTIAQFTALAVLLPVVAGQSGNAGAQAQAVTMRGLALREIRVRHWFVVMFKEMQVGVMNGLAVALVAAAAVYVWSRSLGLALVITLAMVISMVTAGVAGALVPIVLTRFGQDPAQSSSIVLTTITDVAGFLSFLGIATALSTLLV